MSYLLARTPLLHRALVSPAKAILVQHQRSTAAMQPQSDSVLKSPKPLEERAGHSLVLVRAIAITKLFKSALLLLVGFFAFHILKIHGNAHDMLQSLVEAVRLDPHNTFIHGLLQKTLGIQESTLRWLSAGTLLYAGLYLGEGIGLFFDKGWAEWLTVITTAGFIPLELLEIARNITPLRVIVFILNGLILVYIALRLRWRHFRAVQEREGATNVRPAPQVP
jgi:uncharacterized membrane protein (DUF2068 family)